MKRARIVVDYRSFYDEHETYDSDIHKEAVA
jgi:hypothetical protein